MDNATRVQVVQIVQSADAASISTVADAQAAYVAFKAQVDALVSSDDPDYHPILTSIKRILMKKGIRTPITQYLTGLKNKNSGDLSALADTLLQLLDFIL